jgi:hypothetical protein
MTGDANIPATRAMVIEQAGEPTKLVLTSDDGALASLVLGPADAIALASDLLNAARRRLGRGEGR